MNNKTDIQNIITNYERAICRIVLACLTELPFQLGTNKTASVLKGTKSTFNIDNELYILDTFGVLGNFTVKQLRQIIEMLIEFDLISIEKITGWDLPVLTLSEEGQKYLENNSDTEIVILDALIDREVPQFDEQEKELFENLRTIRQELAAEADIPAFMICGDQLLRQICKQKPKDPDELLSIKGAGENFVNNYGEQILKTIEKK